jgi:hypothetical protein
VRMCQSSETHAAYAVKIFQRYARDLT